MIYSDPQYLALTLDSRIIFAETTTKTTTTNTQIITETKKNGTGEY